MPEPRGHLLADVPLFAALSADERDSLARLSHDVRRREGEMVVGEGDDSAMGFYLILDGEAVVTRAGEEIGRLHPGDFFGEVSLVERRPRTATVTAAKPLQLLCISAWNFEAFLGTNPEVGRTITRAAGDRAR
jgi:CRP-like cAMP-binding protein